MEKILISACLVGDKVKYNGQSNYNPKIKELLEKYELVPFCPEVEGGLPTPRTPNERVKDKVLTEDGRDVTKPFEKGADLAYNICMYLGIKIAVLKALSPSCGSNFLRSLWGNFRPQFGMFIFLFLIVSYNPTNFTSIII